MYEGPNNSKQQAGRFQRKPALEKKKLEKVIRLEPAGQERATHIYMFLQYDTRLLTASTYTCGLGDKTINSWTKVASAVLRRSYSGAQEGTTLVWNAFSVCNMMWTSNGH